MGRLESLTALALGRGPYEDEVLESSDQTPTSSSGQQYNEHGHPRNPETKRREREHVRAANEVMQVTGVVEDSLAARAKANEEQAEKNQETLTGIRAMEYGRAALVGGIWGVLGLRRRILLYQPYSDIGIFEIIKQETRKTSLLTVYGAGLPAVAAYHVADWVHFFIENILEAVWDEEDDTGNQIQLTSDQMWWKRNLSRLFYVSFAYITLQFRLFAILQQLSLIRASQLLPTLRSFIPFSTHSPLQAPPFPSVARLGSLGSWAWTAAKSMGPLLIISFHGAVKHIVARNLYQPIYLRLPRPIGESIFAGLSISPSSEFDTPDRNAEDRPTTQDDSTLRALEGLPALERMETSRPNERETDSSLEDDGEVTHQALISFDVEATEVDSPLGPDGNAEGGWSAELRSANEPKRSDVTRYRMTGLTLLPAIMATEGLREILAGIIVLPLEALVVRFIGHAYQDSHSLSHTIMFPMVTVGLPKLRTLGNIASVLIFQLGVTGFVWIGFTVVSQKLFSREIKKEKKGKRSSGAAENE